MKDLNEYFKCNTCRRSRVITGDSMRCLEHFKKVSPNQTCDDWSSEFDIIELCGGDRLPNINNPESILRSGVIEILGFNFNGQIRRVKTIRLSKADFLNIWGCVNA